MEQKIQLSQRPTNNKQPIIIAAGVIIIALLADFGVGFWQQMQIYSLRKIYKVQIQQLKEQSSKSGQNITTNEQLPTQSANDYVLIKDGARSYYAPRASLPKGAPAAQNSPATPSADTIIDLRSVPVGQNPPPPPPLPPPRILDIRRFHVTVNYDLSVEAAIAAGKYDFVDDLITKDVVTNSPSPRKGTADVEIFLVQFNRAMGYKEALQELDKQGLRAADLPELLAFGAKYPNVQYDMRIIALSALWPSDEHTFATDIAGYNYPKAARGLELEATSHSWGSNFRFAAVRK